MKKKLIGFLAMAVLSGILSMACKSEGDSDSDSGGGGADFDSTLYYTKTEIDGKLHNYGKVNFNGAGTFHTITASGASSGGPAWTVPSNAKYGVFYLTVGNFTGTSEMFRIRIGSLGTSNDKGFSLLMPSSWYEERILIVPFGAAVPATVYPWLEAPATFPTSNFSVSVDLLYWVIQEYYIN